VLPFDDNIIMGLRLNEYKGIHPKSIKDLLEQNKATLVSRGSCELENTTNRNRWAHQSDCRLSPFQSHQRNDLRVNGANGTKEEDGQQNGHPDSLLCHPISVMLTTRNCWLMEHLHCCSICICSLQREHKVLDHEEIWETARQLKCACKHASVFYGFQA